MTRAFASLAILLLCTGCGFHPLYGDAGGGAVEPRMRAIFVEPVSDLSVANTGYDLRNAMIDTLDSNNDAALYRLKMTFSETTQGIALQTNASITRYNDTLTVNYELTDATSGAVLTKGVETGLSGYNVVSSPYASLVAQQDADRRAVKDIAERIRIDLGVWFDQHRATPK